MTDARAEILKKIRVGLDQALLPEALPAHPEKDVPRARGGINEFVAEVERISGQVIRASSALEAARYMATLCVARGYRQVLCWAWSEINCPGLDAALADVGIQIVQEGTPQELALLPLGITGAEAALADSGTLVMRNGAGRSSLVSLLPPVHVALVNTRRIYPDMQSYFDSLPDAVMHTLETNNLVFVSGPSRTADIEQTLTLGMHGPRELIVVLWGN